MRSILFAILIFSCNLSQAQDLHLTQYYTSNLSLNPALTGHYEGDIRVVANYRNQWRQVNRPINTNMFSFEKKYSRFNDEVGLGMILINDHISALNLSTNKVMVAASVQKDLNGNFIRVGLQGGVVHRSTDLGSQTFPDQWNYGSGIFDRAIDHGENMFENYTHPIFNGGVSWGRAFGKSRLMASYGLMNINRPRENFLNKARQLPFRHVVNASLSYQVDPQLSLTPHLLYMQTQNVTDMIAGINARKRLNRDLAVLIGAGYRGSSTNRDALLGIVGFGYRRFDIGFSYDFTFSQLNNDLSNKSALEFSLMYTTPSRQPGKVTIPCDRY